MVNHPGQDVVNAVEAGIAQITRRVEIYEADGVTPWFPSGSEEDTFRLLSGSVSVDSSRDERRALDMMLDNEDNNLRPDPNNGFWYDKMIRPYRGVKYITPRSGPRILIIEAFNAADSLATRDLFTSLGYPRVDINLSATTLADLKGYELIVSSTKNAPTEKAALLKAAYNLGFNIFTKGLGNGAAHIPWVLTTSTSTGANPRVTPAIQDTPFSGGWTDQAQGNHGALTRILTVSPSVQVAATSLNTVVWISAAGEENPNGARWFNFQSYGVATQGKILLSKAFQWLWNYTPFREWETPLGDFFIDNIKTKNFPDIVSLSGRDQTKFCLNSKIEKNMAFEAGTSVNELIRSLAANAGIKKIRLHDSEDGQLGTRIDAARTDPRWNLMKSAANFLNRNLFFDVEGYLTTSIMADPTLGDPVITFQTGESVGNLTDYERAISDDRIYNHIVVTGTSETSEETGLEFFGEAINDNPASPTRREVLGDRSYFYTSAFFTNDQQCVDYANLLLTQTALEQYELNWSSIVYPWLDTGVVTEFIDPKALPHEPTRFLLDTLTIPLGLEPMSGTGKRILYVEGTPVPASVGEDLDPEEQD